MFFLTVYVFLTVYDFLTVYVFLTVYAFLTEYGFLTAYAFLTFYGFNGICIKFVLGFSFLIWFICETDPAWVRSDVAAATKRWILQRLHH
jgi:hypothetical protein